MPLLRDEVKSPLNVPLFLYDFQKQASSCPLQEEFVAAFSLNGCVLVLVFFLMSYSTQPYPFWENCFSIKITVLMLICTLICQTLSIPPRDKLNPPFLS